MFNEALIYKGNPLCAVFYSLLRFHECQADCGGRMADTITYLTYYFGEWPYIFTIGLAVYLSFEYWDFPDLTIESAFTAGMVSTFLAFKLRYPHPVLWLFVLCGIP